MATRGQQWLGASEDLEGPHGGAGLGVRGSRGTYLGWAEAARGPSLLEGCQEARVGGCSKPEGGGGSPRPYSGGVEKVGEQEE